MSTNDVQDRRRDLSRCRFRVAQLVPGMLFSQGGARQAGKECARVTSGASHRNQDSVIRRCNTSLVLCARTALHHHVQPREPAEDLAPLDHVLACEQGRPVIPGCAASRQDVNNLGRLPEIATGIGKASADGFSSPFYSTCEQDKVWDRRERASDLGTGLCAVPIPELRASENGHTESVWDMSVQSGDLFFESG